MPPTPPAPNPSPWGQSLLHAGPLALVSFAFALCFYTPLLPDVGGHAACTRLVGWNPQEYGARFCKQWLLNGAGWWNTDVYRYSMPPAAFARMQQDMLAEGWHFDAENSDGKLGTVAGHYYPIAFEDDVEVGYSGCAVVTYNRSDEYLYVEYTHGTSWRHGGEPKPRSSR